MVLDPLSALGVAASVAQFVDFSSKLVSKQRELKRNLDGILVEHKEIQAASAAMQGQCKSLEQYAQRTGTKQQSSAGQDTLATVTRRASGLAREPSAALDELYVTSVNKHFKSFRQALKSVWAKGQINEMYAKLNDLRAELMLGLLIVMREEQDFEAQARQADIKQSEIKILDALKRMETQNKQQMADLQRRITPGYFSNRALSARIKSAQTWVSQNVSLINHLSTDIFQSVQDSRESQMRIQLLNSLSFPEMNLRYSEIATAQERTLNWMYSSSMDPIAQTPWANFSDWLIGRDAQYTRLYWVSGKPGSGKSTLMRFLCDDKRTIDLSQQWSSGREVLIASCYFWNPGTMLQKSQQGLLQSLLYQLLTRCSGFPGSIFAQRWRLLNLGADCDHDWTTGELREAVFACVEYLTTTSNVLLFVDGLDEFHGDSDQRQQVCDLLIDLAGNQNVKVCTSSRPWNIYQQAFGDDFPMLRLEDLTRNDIWDYVEDEFRSHKLVQAWAASQPDNCEAFFSALVERAQGVFLWVRLVVRSLLTGLQNHDDLMDLSRRLEEIPPDLEAYFKKMMLTLDSFYLEQASQVFEVALQGSQLLMTFYFMHPRSPEEELKSSKPHLGPAEIQRCQVVQDRRLNARCMGLVESKLLPTPSSHKIYRVDFLHRTAKDFIVSDYAQDLLESWRKTRFDADGALLRSHICLLRSCDSASPWLNADLFSAIFRETMRIARRTNLTNDMFELLDEFGKRIDQLPKSMKLHLFYRESQVDFLAYAVHNGLHAYALEKMRQLQRNPLRHTRDAPLLHYALSVDLAEDRNSSLAVVEHLLARGADVNEVCKDTTIWGAYLRHLLQYRDKPCVQREYEVVKRLVRAGPLDAICTGIVKSPAGKRHAVYVRTLNFEDVFRRVLSAEQTKELMSLLKHTAWWSIGAMWNCLNAGADGIERT